MNRSYNKNSVCCYLGIRMLVSAGSVVTYLVGVMVGEHLGVWSATLGLSRLRDFEETTLGLCIVFCYMFTVDGGWRLGGDGRGNSGMMTSSSPPLWQHMSLTTFGFKSAFSTTMAALLSHQFLQCVHAEGDEQMGFGWPDKNFICCSVLHRPLNLSTVLTIREYSLIYLFLLVVKIH